MRRLQEETYRRPEQMHLSEYAKRQALQIRIEGAHIGDCAYSERKRSIGERLRVNGCAQ